MMLSARVLGAHTVAALTARVRNAVLVIGRDRFTRADLAGVECFSYVAAANLSAQLEAFKPVDTRDVFNRLSPLALAVPRLGAVSLAVLGAAFEHKGLPTLDLWVTKHRAPTDTREIVTFATIKARSADAKAARREHRRATTAHTHERPVRRSRRHTTHRTKELNGHHQRQRQR